ncbi:dUTP diphosphatase [Paracoccus aurantiacus]|uniref:Deoxyuridine 5'-triphosphate nucleotidohydrolase n=1 Tax=Paracoccus aurantiacus TaxID=2599412 RepID=A0A5C6S3S7_9RHOB|nr:dUTP diphosphatase [Paracoccus aurantiacus]TXB68630.1 dUTP diphosphatase [Paracoccus aurantiacus]
MQPEILILKDEGADPLLPLPAYETAGAAGADLRADLRGDEVTLAPLERRLIPTGLKMQIPPGFEVQVRARSGAALRDGLAMANGVGTIDCDYRGPVGVIAVNLSDRPLVIRHGDRIAQIIVAPVVQAKFTQTASIDQTARGEGGFGSTGRG